MNALDKLRVGVGVVITALWGTSVVLDFIVPSYDVPANVHGLMLLVATALFGPTIYSRGVRRNGDNGAK